VPVEYLDLASVAAQLGVKANTVYQWRLRYRDREPRFPAPDVTLGSREGWRADRIGEFRVWMASRPGQGAGGGRPKKSRTEE
jgi:hypothetical protein